jgi:hypothetical protein
MNILEFDGLDITGTDDPVSAHPRVSVLSPGTSDMFSTPSSSATGGLTGGARKALV